MKIFFTALLLALISNTAHAGIAEAASGPREGGERIATQDRAHSTDDRGCDWYNEAKDCVGERSKSAVQKAQHPKIRAPAEQKTP